MTKIDVAIHSLAEHNYTCAAYDGATFLTSFRRGVAPLLEWLDSGVDLSNFAVADKVVGKGAAFLYVLLGTRQIHAHVISKPALYLLRSFDAEVTYDVCVDAILNRHQTDFCPIETAVMNAVIPEEALLLIRNTLKQIQK